MNRYHDEIQLAIANLGDHLSRAQLLMRYLAQCRALDDDALDPETDLAVVCWLEEANEVLGRTNLRLRRQRPLV
ncbi:MAG: hypothetical protein R3D98_16495 [Candidatus Krumholzibacteriia bacterium]